MVYFRKGDIRGSNRRYCNMSDHPTLKKQNAQTSIEYMLLLMAVVTIVIIGIQTFFPYVEQASNIYYNRAVPGILGDAPLCGDGWCSDVEKLDGLQGKSRCPMDC